MVMKITRSLNLQGASTPLEVIRAQAQTVAKLLVAPNFPAITDNSGGNASANATVVFAPATVGAVASGSNLVTKASADAALLATQNALATLFSAVAKAHVKLGLTPLTYNGGGTDGNGTVAAIPVGSLAGGSTGPAVATFEPIRLAYNSAISLLEHRANDLAWATGDALLVSTQIVGEGPYQMPLATASTPATLAALAANTGTAQSPGVTLAEATAVFTAWQNDIAKVAAFLNGLRVITNVTPAVIASR